MVLFAAALFCINRLYLRVTGQLRGGSDEPQRLRGPLEPLLSWSFRLALIALLVWWLLFSHGPGPQTML